MLICFDVDGTLDCKDNDNESSYLKGIIPEKLLVELWKKGHEIAIVSPSPYFPDKWKGKNHWFAEFGSNEMRWRNISDAMAFYKRTSDLTIYVDDLEANRKNVLKIFQDITCYSPEEFMRLKI